MAEVDSRAEGFWPAQNAAGQIRKSDHSSSELTVKTVCGICNNGWMNDLEAENIPIIGYMLQDITVPLDKSRPIR